MSKLPCDSRMIMIDSSGRQMKFLWGVISSVVISLIIVVAANISVIGELRKEITAVKEELIFIKNHSYGVQEYLNGGKKASQLP